jgi:hypothetical protein
MIDNFTAPDRTANSFYNTGCIDEINKIIEDCTEFKAQVLQSVSTRFKVAVIMMITLIIIRFFLEYSNWNSEWKVFIIKRLDVALIVTALVTIAMFFI